MKALQNIKKLLKLTNAILKSYKQFKLEQGIITNDDFGKVVKDHIENFTYGKWQDLELEYWIGQTSNKENN